MKKQKGKLHPGWPVMRLTLGPTALTNIFGMYALQRYAPSYQYINWISYIFSYFSDSVMRYGRLLLNFSEGKKGRHGLFYDTIAKVPADEVSY
jgi:hypothetical protein